MLLLLFLLLIILYCVVFNKCLSGAPKGWCWVCVGGGGVCKVIFVSNPTAVLRLCCRWGCDNCFNLRSSLLQRSSKFLFEDVLDKYLRLSLTILVNYLRQLPKTFLYYYFRQLPYTILDYYLRILFHNVCFFISGEIKQNRWFNPSKCWYFWLLMV